jgi:hypothetical protein
MVPEIMTGTSMPPLRNARLMPTIAAFAFERDVAKTRIIDVRRNRCRAIGRAEGAGHIARLTGFGSNGVGALTREARGRGVQFGDQRLHAVVRHRRRVRVERIRLDDIGTGTKKRIVDIADHFGARDGQEIIVALDVTLPVREALAAIFVFTQPEALDHRTHRAVQQQDTLVK